MLHPLEPGEHRNVLLGLVTRGNLVRGCVLSTAGAIAGGVIWCVAALITQMEFGYLALGIGGVAGAGMLFGCKKATTLRGVIAAAIATGGILLGRGLIILYATMPTVDHEMRKCDPRIVRLASHYSEVEGMCRGMHPRDEARYDLYSQGADRLAELKDDELDQRIAELNEWENGGCDQDEEYVLHALAYCIIADDPAKTVYARHRVSLIPENEWPATLDAARRKASALSVEQRLDALRDYRARNDRYETIVGLALKRADVRAVRERLPFSDDRRAAVENEELATLWDMSDPELQQAADEQEAWQREQRWEDHRYLRNYVIFGIVTRHMEDRGAEESDDIYKPSEQDWEKLWAVSAAEIDGKDDHDLIAMAEEFERLREQKARELEERDNNAPRIPSKPERVAGLTPHILVEVVNELGVSGYAYILVAVILAYSLGGVDCERTKP